MSRQRIASPMSTLVQIAALLAVPASAAESETPVTASPGEVDHFAQVRSSCPTFSWGLVKGASHYDVEIFRLHDLESKTTGTSVATKRLPGSVTSWTPDTRQCLEPGPSYAWFVRAEVDGQLSEWSQARLLEIAGAPTIAEVSAAREVLEHFLTRGGLESDDLGSRALAEEGGATQPQRRVASSKRSRSASLSGTAAIRGHSTQVSGDANGMVGISSSPDGAGVVAAGAGIGVDLVLDGSTSSQSDTLLSQGGIDRPSSSPEFFAIENSGGGGLTLEVSGAVTATSFAGDGSALTGLAIDDIQCSGCVGNTDLALGSVNGATVQNGSLTGTDIATASITASDLASNSVDSSEIASNAVRGGHLAGIRAVAVECNGECDDSTLSQICGAGYRPLAVDCNSIRAFSASACGGDNQCTTYSVGYGRPLSEYCNDVSGFDAHVYCLQE